MPKIDPLTSRILKSYDIRLSTADRHKLKGSLKILKSDAHGTTMNVPMSPNEFLSRRKLLSSPPDNVMHSPPMTSRSKT
jgi:hypothetical protein